MRPDSGSRMSKDPILTVKFSIGDRSYEEDLAAHALIQEDVAGLNKALYEHPGRFAWWATLEALARGKVESLQTDLREFEADNIDIIVSTLEKHGQKVPSIKQLKDKVGRMPTCRKMIRALNAARQEYRRIQIGRKTIEAKKDSVLTIANLMRAEMGAGHRPNLKEEIQKANDGMRQVYGTEPLTRRQRRG